MFASEPLSWQTLLTAWSLPPVAGVLIAVLAVLYLWATTRTKEWPKRNTVSFLAGLGVLTFSVGGSVNSYSGVLFSMHMAQHLLLITVAPALLVLGHPLELLRRGTVGQTRRWLGRVKHSRLVAGLTHPLPGIAYYAAVVVVTHLSPFLQLALTDSWLHALELALYVSSGYLLLLPILGREPIRRHLAHFTRLLVLLASMIVDTVVGVTLMMTLVMPFPVYAAQARDWGPALVQDLHWGGAAMWVGGDTLMAALALIVMATWVKAPSGINDLGPWLESARRNALAGTRPESPASNQLADSNGIDSDEEALRAYNNMLARLAEHDRDTRGPPV